MGMTVIIHSCQLDVPRLLFLTTIDIINTGFEAKKEVKPTVAKLAIFQPKPSNITYKKALATPQIYPFSLLLP